MSDSTPPIRRSVSPLGLWICPALATLIGAAMLALWAANANALKTTPHLRDMNPTSALTLLLAGIALFLLVGAKSRPMVVVGRLITLLVLLIGAVRLLDFAGLIHFPTDELLFADRLADEHGVVSRLAPNTALNFLLAACAMLAVTMRRERGVWIAQSLALLSMALCLVALLGYLFGVKYLYTFHPAMPMPVQTAVGIGALCAGVLGMQRDRAIVAIRRQLLGKIYAGYAAAIVLTAIIIGLLADWQVGEITTAIMQDRLHTRTALLAEFSIPYFDGKDTPLDSPLQSLDSNSQRVTFIRPDGSILLDSQPSVDKNINLLARPEIQDALHQGWGMVQRGDSSEKGMIFYALPVISGNKMIGFVRAGFSLESTQNQRSMMRGAILLGAALASAVVMAASFFLARHVSLRASRMIESVHAMTGGDYGKRLPVQGSDELAQLAGAFNDLADQLQIRIRQLQESHEIADAANQSKSEFLANMSHEIRTPMTAIIGYADLMLDAEQSASERLNCINTVRRNGEHLMSIINDILDLSKIEANRMEVEHIACSPCKILGEVASLMRIRTQEKRIRFEVKTEGLIPETIRSDPQRIRQILINLVGNAIKFTDHGLVLLRTSLDPQIPQSSDPAATSRLRFDVVNTGLGISEQQRKHLFTPFAQADGSTTRRFGGTGLGLTICKRFAELLGGEIRVDSELGQGSTFSLLIQTGPLTGVRMLRDCREAAEDSRPGTQRMPAAGPVGGRVLLADDGHDNRALLSHYLRKMGAQVTLAENGKEASQLAMASHQSGRAYDLILMDMQMPELDGYGATSRLRSRGYIGPIVALTAHAMQGDREKCLQAGCDDYISKPVSRQILEEMVRRYLSGNQNAEPPAPPE